MVKISAKGERIRQFIIQGVAKHPANIRKLTADHFRITPQGVGRHLVNLVKEGALEQSRRTRNCTYKLTSSIEYSGIFNLLPGLEEGFVWFSYVKPVVSTLPENVVNILHFGFTEMFNNVLDHSEASTSRVVVVKTASTTSIRIFDDGIGIFKKITKALNLLDERHAVLELAKGKFTTDPNRHTGEGIFFTSRMFNSFDILSGGVYFSHDYSKEEDWIFASQKNAPGTMVWMTIDNHTSRTARRIFDQYSSVEPGFTKTVVPVKLAQYGDDNLVSRSQAKRVLARIDRFKVVIFDFRDIEFIGQAFADEIFRVFAKQHPKIEMKITKANTSVKKMILRVKALNN